MDGGAHPALSQSLLVPTVTFEGGDEIDHIAGDDHSSNFPSPCARSA